LQTSPRAVRCAERRSVSAALAESALAIGAAEGAVASVAAAPADLSAQRFAFLLGPLLELLEDRRVQNIDVNADGGIHVERFGDAKVPHGAVMRREARVALISYLANVAGRAITSLSSRLHMDMPVYGARVFAACPPVEDWTLCIRVPIANVPALEDYVERGIVSQAQCRVLVEAIAAGKKLAFGGNVNSGKTTVLNAALKKKAEFHGNRRAVGVQDRQELRLDGFPDRKIITARVEQAHYDASGGLLRYTYEFSDALEDALRSDGDFMVWSEVKDGFSAFGLALACNTGQTRGLMFTLHADSLADIPDRIGELILLHNKPVIPKMVGRVFDTIAYMQRDDDTGVRRLVAIGEVETTPAGYTVRHVA
jgi:type IV secretion system protein TrbB